MKFLLLQNYDSCEFRSPIAVLDLAAYGRAFGHTVRVDYLDAIDRKIDFDYYDVIGVSAVYYSQEIVERLIKLRHLTSTRLILGGKCVNNLYPHEKAGITSIGVEVFEGPGEYLFSSRPMDYASYPAWELEDFRKMDRHNSAIEVMSSRGCPYQCHFCNNTEPKVSYFSLERTVANCRIVLEKRHKGCVFLVDDIFTLRPNRMVELMTLSKTRGLDLTGRTQFFAHVNQLTPPVVKAIQIVNPQEIQIGIESGDNRMLKRMGKSFTSEKASSKIRYLHSQGLNIACLFLLGFPGESEESLRNTVRFVEENRKYMSGCCAGYYQVVPGTVGWKMAKERIGEDIRGTWNRNLTYIDPNITQDLLTKAHDRIMDIAQNYSPKKGIPNGKF